MPLGVLLVMKILEDEWNVIEAYKLAIFEILKVFCVVILRQCYPYKSLKISKKGKL